MSFYETVQVISNQDKVGRESGIIKRFAGHEFL